MTWLLSLFGATTLALKNSDTFEKKMPSWLSVSLWLIASIFLLPLGYVIIQDKVFDHYRPLTAVECKFTATKIEEAIVKLAPQDIAEDMIETSNFRIEQDTHRCISEKRFTRDDYECVSTAQTPPDSKQCLAEAGVRIMGPGFTE